MDITMSKSETVRARRVALGITQRELARLAACSTTMVQEIEAGSTRGGRALANVLDVLAEREDEAREAREFLELDEVEHGAAA
jgi:predicted transcriptional regulator